MKKDIDLTFTLDEAVSLIKELPQDHWLTDRIMSSIANNALHANPPEVTFDLIKPSNKPTISEVKECQWETYGYYCHKAVEVNATRDFCKEHIDKACNYCGDPATHGCPEEQQFVCGEPICDNCRHGHRKI